MKPKYITYFMNMAKETAKLSSARRLKVGTIVVKDNQVIATGYNGTFPGTDNNCEIENSDGTLTTKPTVYHSEQNALIKLMRSTESSKGAVMFTTHACCLQCSMNIAGAGITDFYYETEYRGKEGLEFLEMAGVRIHKCEEV